MPPPAPTLVGDPYSIKQAHIRKIANENGSEATIWHYRVSKQHESNQLRMSPHEMLIELARTLHQSDNQFSIIHQKTTTTTTVGCQEIEVDSDMSNYTSSCTTAKGATSTTLLVSITNNYSNLQQLERLIDNLAVSFAGRWHICPDIFCGLKSCMVGVFTNVLPDGVNWSKSVAMLAQEVDRKAVVPGTLRVEIRPDRFGFEDKSGA